MTETTDNSTASRSKLTLKLSPKLASDTAKVAAPKVAEKRSSTSVQVTIKGRKAPAASDQALHQGLSKSEFEARIKAISSNTKASVDDDHNVLDKITKVNAKQAKEAEEKAVAAVEVEEKIVAEVAPEVIEEAKPVAQESSSKPRDIDAFSVRDNIKQSVELSNRQKAEREKLLEDRRKQEQEKLEKEKEARAKTKKFTDDFESANQKKKPAFKDSFKDSKVNTRKLTYIIDEDADDGRGFRRRKKSRDQHVAQSTKEYKKIIHEVDLPELITVADLSDRMAEKTGDVVKKLFSIGMVATSNQVIDADTAELIISEFGHIAKRVSHSDVESVLGGEDDSNLEKSPRAPVVTIM